MEALAKILGGGTLTKENYREKITRAEEILATFPQVDLPVVQHFLPGVYVREIFIPAGVILTGGAHKEDCVSIVSQGAVLVATIDGNKIIKAGESFISKAGHKRIGIGVEDCKWATVHKYDGPELPEEYMKQVVSCDTYALYDEYLEVLKLEAEYQETKAKQ